MRKSSNKPSTSSLKIGLLLDDSLDSQDGVQQYVLTLAKWLREQGHSVHYLAGQTSRIDLDKLHSLARVIRLNFNGNRLGTPLPANRRRLNKLLVQHQFDVVHLQAPYSPLLAGRLINLLPAKTAVVCSFHVLPNSRMADLGLGTLRYLLASSLPKIDKFIANTTTVADFFRKRWQVSSVVIPNPVDCPAFQTSGRYPTAKTDKLNLVFLGRLVKRKGVLNLIEGLRLLPATYQDKVYLHIGGAGRLMPEVRRLLKTYQLDQLAQTYGRIQEADKAAFLSMADIAIFPSTGGESFGISLIEAMSTGKGVVLAGQNPGYQAVLGRRPELLFDAKRPLAIAQTLEDWIKAPVARRQAARAWLNSEVKRYDISSSVGPQILEVYRQAIKTKT